MSNLPDQNKSTGFIQSKGPSSAHVQLASQRFLLVNSGRIDRVREGFQPKQQQCFDLLPLLFHINSEALPGFIANEQTPTGISNYHPDESLIRLANSIAKGHINPNISLRKAQISALYSMGSSGSIGHSTTSDLDIWLCYEPNLDDRQINLLSQKAEKISQWANSFNLEVHFFLMNAHRFQGGEQQSLTGENCGSTQHALLLDEFYRTAQLLAGNIPAWWLVPVDYENQYQDTIDTLYRDGHVSSQSCTDFGPVSKLPAGEFIGAGMWQIYKAIDSPYKSVLKLILLEIYAQEYPNIYSLAHEYKTEIYRMHLSLEHLDPYVMLYQRIERYLSDKQEQQRLDLIRRCFYFKVGLNLSKSTRTFNWRRELMEQLVSSWGWNKATIAHLDNFRFWTIEEVIQERRLLINELTHSYRFLTEFSSEHHSSHVMSQRDLLILSRKLHAAFDRRQGKIDFIRIGLDIDLSNEKIQIHQRESKQQPGVYLWAAYNQAIDQEPTPSPLKYSKGLLETLLWSHLNGLISAHLHIPVYPLIDNISEYEIRMTLASLRQHLAIPMPKVEGNSFYHPAILTKVVLFINLGHDPLQYLSQKGLQKISARSNSLDFSSMRENLVLTLDMVLVNTWGEVVVERFEQQQALTDALRALVNRISKQARAGLPSIEAICHNQTRPQAIAQRVKDLFTEALANLCSPSKPKGTRFIFNLGEQFILFQQQQRQTLYQSFEQLDQLKAHLAEEQIEYSPVVFDQQCQLEQPLLAQLFHRHEENSICLAFELLAHNSAQLFVIDELGSMVEFKLPVHSIETLLAPVIRFIKITEHRQRSGSEAQFMPARQLNCLQIMRNNRQIELRKIKISGLLNRGRFISIQVNVDQAKAGGYEYHLVCNDKEFHSSVLGKGLYNAVASYILGLRASGQKYPTYITDLSLSQAVIDSLPYAHDQSLHYVRLKLKLEKRINEAMATL